MECPLKYQHTGASGRRETSGRRAAELSEPPQRLCHRRLVRPHFRPDLLLGPQDTEPMDTGRQSQTFEDPPRPGIHLYRGITGKNYADCAAVVVSLLNISVLSVARFGKNCAATVPQPCHNCATTVPQLCHNEMQKHCQLFCVGLYDFLRMPARCFAYARKVFCVCQKGRPNGSRPLCKRTSNPVQTLLEPRLDAPQSPFGHPSNLVHSIRKTLPPPAAAAAGRIPSSTTAKRSPDSGNVLEKRGLEI